MPTTTTPASAGPGTPERHSVTAITPDGVERRRWSVSRECAILWLRIVGVLWRFRARLMRLCSGQAGTSTAEYAIATLAAVAFAGLLVVIMRSDEVRGFLLNIIRTALAIP
ncbi:DUF4244 domain-containing protein [Arthrobacter woluwensis]|uniref:DUF4244 domain-containing protein n=1 Tax=Arthrobacter woluwensis TaxID=156980 RepID=UPI001FBBE480|nr:DUF4244 domain-containing protein [Arthrobacter woluwensis]